MWIIRTQRREAEELSWNTTTRLGYWMHCRFIKMALCSWRYASHNTKQQVMNYTKPKASSDQSTQRVMSPVQDLLKLSSKKENKLSLFFSFFFSFFFFFLPTAPNEHQRYLIPHKKMYSRSCNWEKQKSICMPCDHRGWGFDDFHMSEGMSNWKQDSLHCTTLRFVKWCLPLDPYDDCWFIWMKLGEPLATTS